MQNYRFINSLFDSEYSVDPFLPLHYCHLIMMQFICKLCKSHSVDEPFSGPINPARCPLGGQHYRRAATELRISSDQNVTGLAWAHFVKVQSLDGTLARI